MKITGEYSIQYNIYTMFDVYNVEIKNHNLITNLGYEFFFEKWFKKEDTYPIEKGYYYQNDFYKYKNIDGGYEEKMSIDDTYSTTTNYIDIDTNRQYRFDGEHFINFTELIDKISVGKCEYSDENLERLSEKNTNLFNISNEYEIEDIYLRNRNELVLKYGLDNNDLDGVTEIGVKTNRGRLISHDIHPPYNLPFDMNLTLEYIFKLE